MTHIRKVLPPLIRGGGSNYDLTANSFRNKSSIIDVQLGYIQAFKNIEIFKVKQRWSKSSRLLQHAAFLVLFILERA